ncbi:hypothetical protein BKA82DRAFT_3143650 [Pisolithus tinctorius]|nr:hypothetical protein BKA82DRAFT_3143650 [Pisolithus tinctorius]
MCGASHISYASKQEDRWEKQMIAIFGSIQVDGPLPLLPPLSEDESCGQKRKSKSKDTYRSPEGKERKLIKGFQREMKNMVKKAKSDSVIFESFNFVEAIKKLQMVPKRSEATVMQWLDGKPRVAKSSDGVDIICHLPMALKECARKELYQALMEFGHAVNAKPDGGADRNKRNVKSSYVQKEGELAGIVKLVAYWKMHGPKTPSRDYLKSGRQFCLATAVLNKLNHSALRINAAFEALDEKQYSALKTLREKVLLDNPFARMIASNYPLLFEGLAIMWNRQTPLHSDNTDPINGWVALMVLAWYNYFLTWPHPAS